jgi:two-component system sensor histidine kinase KdpD
MSVEVARRSDALKSALLDSVSHDLRTPLASIRAAAGSLMDPAVHWSAEEERSTAASIDREAERLNRLVSNILDLSRIEAGGLVAQHSAFPLEDLVPDVLERLAPVLGTRPIEVRIPAGLPPVDVDEVFIDQVLTNLLENAARYAGPTATLRISAHQLGPGRIGLTIEDSGPGVPADALTHLFEKFYRVPVRGEGARRGTGLGLAVVRGLVETMGGTINARRSELGGLAMDLELVAAQ